MVRIYFNLALKYMFLGGPYILKYENPWETNNFRGVHMLQLSYEIYIPGVPNIRTGGNHFGGSKFFMTGHSVHIHWSIKPRFGVHVAVTSTYLLDQKQGPLLLPLVLCRRPKIDWLLYLPIHINKVEICTTILIISLLNWVECQKLSTSRNFPTHTSNVQVECGKIIVRTIGQMGEVESAEVWKPKYGNEVQKWREEPPISVYCISDLQLCFVGKGWLSLNDMRARHWHIGPQRALTQSFNTIRWVYNLVMVSFQDYSNYLLVSRE